MAHRGFPVMLESSNASRDNVSRDIWRRNPRPQPQKLSKYVCLIEFDEFYICLNWLPGALVGVGGSDFICIYTCMFIVWEVCIHANKYVYMYVYINIHIYENIYIYICMCTHTHVLCMCM